MMTDQLITCPNCKHEFALTESLAAPLVEATRREFEARLVSERERIVAEESARARAALEGEMAGKAAEIADLQDLLKQRNEKVAELQKAQAELARQRQELEDARQELEVTVAEKLRGEREKISTDAEKKARLALGDEMEARARENAELQESLAAQRAKLAEAQAAQVELLKKQRELEHARAEMELNIQKGIQEGLEASRLQARKEAEEALSLRLAESQHTIDGMKKQIEDLKRRAEQGSQQLQGEVLELELEARLGGAFPLDTIAPVPKGEFGGDALQTVRNPLGQVCGSILWESKRTKNWSDGWLQKLKDDQRAAKAELAIIVSQALPKDVDTFDLVDGIWVTSPRCALPLAVSLRQTLMELANLRQSREGQETKVELVYEYLTGPHFRQRVQAIVEAFSTMREDLAKEKRAIQTQWAKREKQLERVLGATAGMYGDLQGIAGQGIQEIEGLALLEMEGGEDVEDEI